MISAALNHTVTVEIYYIRPQLIPNALRMLTPIATKAWRNMPDTPDCTAAMPSVNALPSDLPTCHTFKVEVALANATPVEASLWACTFASEVTQGCHMFLQEIDPKRTRLSVTTEIPPTMWPGQPATT